MHGQRNNKLSRESRSFCESSWFETTRRPLNIVQHEHDIMQASSNTITVLKLRSMRHTGHVESTGEIRNATNNSVGKGKRPRQLGTLVFTYINGRIIRITRMLKI
jgi:hypothetical protein